MKTFRCVCGADLFFHSDQCVGCGRSVCRCGSCAMITAVDDQHRCMTCNASLVPCHNRTEHGVCNGSVLADSSSDEKPLCRYCDLNRVIPDLSIEGHLQKWRLVERAKHRVLYDIDRIGLPLVDDLEPALIFDFKSPEKQPVSTGHADGVITLDLNEADSVHRERTRVQFGEPHRTLVGHFRHELGHYFWQKCVLPNCIDAFRDQFGDERDPSYVDARDAYYQRGAPADWQQNFVSEYSTMHPWEDFAETFNAYLDMVAIARTFDHFQSDGDVDLTDFDALIVRYRRIGVMANELNRDIGLLDLVPEVFTPPVIEKMQFVHQLAQSNQARESASSVGC
ncbi:zinc-binding metallopeptidase family protein [Roseiconus lacunae]|uniref:zinc-binding metallopeptidase family protein n=2 Tax=Roseiconus lacunae TaxID=2605694 RepID=UPI0011F1B575|nr:putative zinc-binding metallopeptidase [Roseiconus lacunae]